MTDHYNGMVTLNCEFKGHAKIFHSRLSDLNDAYQTTLQSLTIVIRNHYNDPLRILRGMEELSKSL